MLIGAWLIVTGMVINAGGAAVLPGLLDIVKDGDWVMQHIVPGLFLSWVFASGMVLGFIGYLALAGFHRELRFLWRRLGIALSIEYVTPDTK